MAIAKEDIVFPDGSTLADIMNNPATEDLDMATFKIKSTSDDLYIQVPATKKIVFTREPVE